VPGVTEYLDILIRFKHDLACKWKKKFLDLLLQCLKNDLELTRASEPIDGITKVSGGWVVNEGSDLHA